MAISDKVETTRSDVISMIICRFDHGHANQITDHWFWRLLNNHLSDKEIKEFAKELTSGDGYTQKDFQAVISNLTQWRNSQL